MMTTTTGKKDAWLVSWEREQAKYYATPTGKATKALFAAAEKAGMAAALRSACVEVIVETFDNGDTRAMLAWDPEMTEQPDFVFPAKAYARAAEWLKKFCAAKGWKHAVM